MDFTIMDSSVFCTQYTCSVVHPSLVIAITTIHSKLRQGSKFFKVQNNFVDS